MFNFLGSHIWRQLNTVHVAVTDELLGTKLSLTHAEVAL